MARECTKCGEEIKDGDIIYQLSKGHADGDEDFILEHEAGEYHENCFPVNAVPMEDEPDDAA
jgi:hypothetical protein